MKFLPVILVNILARLEHILRDTLGDEGIRVSKKAQIELRSGRVQGSRTHPLFGLTCHFLRDTPGD